MIAQHLRRGAGSATQAQHRWEEGSRARALVMAQHARKRLDMAITLMLEERDGEPHPIPEERTLDAPREHVHAQTLRRE